LASPCAPRPRQGRPATKAWGPVDHLLMSPSEPDNFPEIPRPIARGASVCHVLAVRSYVGTLVAACGISCGRFCGEESFQHGMTHCPEHREPLCEQCREIMERFLATGEWAGEEGDPETWGVAHTVCLDVGCGEIIPIAPCWCWEHLRHCKGQECEHGAHLCDAAVHYCGRHAPEHE
jgi:hypothetical protein